MGHVAELTLSSDFLVSFSNFDSFQLSEFISVVRIRFGCPSSFSFHR